MPFDLSLGVPELSAPNQFRLNRFDRLSPKDLMIYPTAPGKSEFEAIRRGVERILPDIDAAKLAFSVHNGGRSALFDVLSALSMLEPNICVTWREPHWFGYDQIVNAAHLAFIPANAIEVEKKPVVAIACFPNNPDGRDDSEWLLEQERHIDYLIVDLVYLTLMPKDQTQSIAKIARAYRQKLVFIFSTSKTCATPGLRVGHAAAFNHQLVSATQKRQFDHANYPSLINRKISAELWEDFEFVDSISNHYADLRAKVSESFSKRRISHNISGMFLWVDTPNCCSDNLLEFVAGRSGFVGSNGLRYGWPTGTRWTLVDGVDYEEIEKLISEYVSTIDKTP